MGPRRRTARRASGSAAGNRRYGATRSARAARPRVRPADAPRRPGERCTTPPSVRCRPHHIALCTESTGKRVLNGEEALDLDGSSTVGLLERAGVTGLDRRVIPDRSDDPLGPPFDPREEPDRQPELFRTERRGPIDPGLDVPDRPERTSCSRSRDGPDTMRRCSVVRYSMLSRTRYVPGYGLPRPDRAPHPGNESVVGRDRVPGRGVGEPSCHGERVGASATGGGTGSRQIDRSPVEPTVDAHTGSAGRTVSTGPPLNDRNSSPASSAAAPTPAASSASRPSAGR